MKILHRVTINSSAEIQRELARLGVTTADHGLITFEVNEADSAWPALQDWITRRRAVDITHTSFSKQELADARWLELIPNWHHGYPQPDDGSFGYRRTTYDLTGWCEQCGAGNKQKRPFQMKGEPKWGRNGVLQLNWVFDEFFLKPEVWSNVFKPHDVAYRPVLNIKGVELTTVAQLVVADEVGIDCEGLPSERCVRCGRVKYLPVTRGPFPAITEEPRGAIARTREYFGSGKQADRRVLVSQQLARALISQNVRGVSLRPVHSNIAAPVRALACARVASVNRVAKP
jgi:hypothetical protein